MRPRYRARRERSLAAARCTAADFANDCSLAGANWSCTVTAKRPCVCVCVCVRAYVCAYACVMRARTGAIAARARALGLDTGLMASSDGASALDNAASEASSAYTDERRWPQTGLVALVQLCALRGRVLRVQVSIRENGRFSRDEHRCPCLLIVDTRRALVRLWAWPLELVGYYCAQPTGEYSAGTTVAVPVGSY